MVVLYLLNNGGTDADSNHNDGWINVVNIDFINREINQPKLLKILKIIISFIIEISLLNLRWSRIGICLIIIQRLIFL